VEDDMARKFDTQAWMRRLLGVTADYDQWLHDYVLNHWVHFGGATLDERVLCLADIAGFLGLAEHPIEERRKVTKALLSGTKMPWRFELLKKFAGAVPADCWKYIDSLGSIRAERLCRNIEDGDGRASLLVDVAELERLYWFATLTREAPQFEREFTRLQRAGEKWIVSADLNVGDLDRDPDGREFLDRAGGVGQWWSLPTTGWAWIDGKAVYASIIDAIAAMGEDEEAA
jgi:hypothetical protein